MLTLIKREKMKRKSKPKGKKKMNSEFELKGN